MKNPGFTFYVRDWLCSRRVLQMSGDAVKAYVYLLSESWLQIPRATLPSDDKILASMARLSEPDWMRVKNEVLQHYKIGECEEHLGRFYNDHLLEVSRKYEKNQRPNNKNARRTRIKRDMNAKKRISSSSSSSISSSVSIAENTHTACAFYEQFKSAWPPDQTSLNPECENWFLNNENIEDKESAIKGAKNFAVYLGLRCLADGCQYPHHKYKGSAISFLQKKKYLEDWPAKWEAEQKASKPFHKRGVL